MMVFSLHAVDDLRPQLAGAYGLEQTKTPNLDRFAQESVTFRRAMHFSASSGGGHGGMVFVHVGGRCSLETLLSLAGM